MAKKLRVKGAPPVILISLDEEVIDTQAFVITLVWDNGLFAGESVWQAPRQVT